MPGYAFYGHVGLTKETTWGTPVAVPSGSFLEAVSENVTLAIERFTVQNIVGMLREPDDYVGLRRVEGEVVVPGYPYGLAPLLQGTFGQIVSYTVVLSGFLWTLDIRPATAETGADNPLTPYTFEIFRDVTSAHRYAGAQMNKLTLTLEPNQALRARVGLIAKTTSMIAKSTPTYPGSPTDPFTWDSASVSLAGAAVDYVESLTIDFDNQLEGIPALTNQTDITRVRRKGPQLVRVSGVVGLEDLSQYAAFVQQSEAVLRVSVTRGSSFQLVLDVPRLVYSAFPLGMAGRERQTVSFEGVGRHNVGSGYAIRALLTTTRSNY